MHWTRNDYLLAKHTRHPVYEYSTSAVTTRTRWKLNTLLNWTRHRSDWSSTEGCAFRWMRPNRRWTLQVWPGTLEQTRRDVSTRFSTPAFAYRRRPKRRRTIRSAWRSVWLSIERLQNDGRKWDGERVLQASKQKINFNTNRRRVNSSTVFPTASCPVSWNFQPTNISMIREVYRPLDQRPMEDRSPPTWRGRAARQTRPLAFGMNRKGGHWTKRQKRIDGINLR